MKNKKLLIQLKYGTLLGIGFSAIQYFRSFSEELEHFMINPVLDLAIVLLFIGIFYFAFTILRDKLLDGVLRFKKAFLFGLGILSIAFGIVFIYHILNYTVIDKDALTKINDKYKKRYIEAISNDTIKNEEIAQFLQKTQNVIEAQQSVSSQNDTIDNMLNVLMQDYGIALNNRPIGDTIHYKMKCFNHFADSIFAGLVKQQVNSSVLFSDFEGITENVITKMKNIDVVQVRYEAEKERIPEHKNKIVAAFYFAVLVIIYGVFFNVFVSLYIFRSKKAKIVDDEDMIEEKSDSDTESENDTEEDIIDIEQDINTKE